jgi:DNA-binding IclR family transcriptional regulator
MDANQAAVLPGAGRNQSLARAFDLLERIAAHPQGASVATLTHGVGLPRATVSRLLASLADAGAVIRDPGGRAWSLGPTILRLSRAIAPVELRDRARPLLQALVEATQETVFLAVPTGPASARVVEELQAPRVIAARGWNDEELTTPASGTPTLGMAVARQVFDKRQCATVQVPTRAATTLVKPRFIAAGLRVAGGC